VSKLSAKVFFLKWSLKLL